MVAGPGGGNRRSTSADVARLAGVSRATVSYVLNAVPNQTISAATRQRVLDAAVELHYQPSPAARTLRKGRSDVVLGLIGDVPHSPIYQQSFAELSQALAEHGLLLVVHPLFPATLPLSQVWRTLTPACVFSFTPLTEADVVSMQAAGTAVAVTLSHSPPTHPWEFSYGDQSVGWTQADHLLDRGHREVVVALTDDPRTRALSAGRVAAVQQRFTDAGHRAPQVIHLPADLGAARSALEQWRLGAPSVTGLVAWNDHVGGVVTRAAAELGWRVPDDLAVIGAYDYPAGSLSSPPLTTVRVDTRTRMRAIAASLAAAVEGAPIQLQPLDQSTLSIIQGDST